MVNENKEIFPAFEFTSINKLIKKNTFNLGRDETAKFHKDMHPAKKPQETVLHNKLEHCRIVLNWFTSLPRNMHYNYKILLTLFPKKTLHICYRITGRTNYRPITNHNILRDLHC